MLGDRLQRVLRARRGKAASGRHPLGRPLVGTDQADPDVPRSHDSILALRALMSRTMSGSLAPRDEGRPMRTASRSAHFPASRQASRSRLRARFLLACDPMERAVVKPSSPVPGWAQSRANLPLARLPCRNTSSNFLRSRVLGAESLAPLGAPATEHVLPVGSPHPDAKTVRLASFAVVGLKRPFHLGGTCGFWFGKDTRTALERGPSTYRSVRGSAMCPASAVAAAVSGETRCVLEPGPCRPS